MKLFKVAKKEINLPVIVLITSGLVILYHIFSYMIPITNNGFVTTNVTPIAADVSGYITKIYVKNGQQVKKGEPLIKVYQRPYQLAYDYAKASYEEAIEHVGVIKRRTEKTTALYDAANSEYQKGKIEYDLKSNPKVKQAISRLEVKELGFKLQALEQKRNALTKQIAVEDQQIVEQEKKIQSLEAAMHNAKVNLELTIVRAPTDGIVDNLYIVLIST